MKKIFYIVFLLSIFQYNSKGQSINLENLENSILEQIELDRVKQDSIFFGSFLRINNSSTNIKSDLINKIDSINILHKGGWNFGFYLISMSNYNNNAILTINRRSENGEFPEKLINCIKHNSKNNNVIYYFYTIKKPYEYINIKLNFENNNPGYAVAGITIFPIEKN